MISITEREIMTKMVRWRCEECGSGCLAPSRPRMDDVRRYCLDCSKQSGRLVRRISPTLEKERAKKAQAQAARRSKKVEAQRQVREQEKARREILKPVLTLTSEGLDVQKEARKIWGLLKEHHRGRPMPKVIVRSERITVDSEGRTWVKPSRNTGRAYMSRGFVTLVPRAQWETLAHEMVHMAVGSRHSDTGRRKVHDEVFYYALKDLCERRWKVQINFSKVRRWGYEVDWMIAGQLIRAGVFEVK